MIYTRVKSFEDLAVHLDDLCTGVTKMLGKTGGRGNNAETIINLMINTTEKKNNFLLLGHDEGGAFMGFIFAILVPSDPPWADFIGMWSRAGVASSMKFEVFEMLKEWAVSYGCKSIMAGLTRKPHTFFKFFHEPLGFENIGIIISYDLKKEKSDG